MRTIIFGDIHGCANAFSALLERTAPIPGQDRLVLLGDLMDRGPDSWQVWQTASALRQRFGQELTILTGNHETYWLQPRPSLWMKHQHNRVGREATVQSFRKHGASTDALRDWLNGNLKPWYRGEGLQCVHAAVRVDPLESNDTYTLVHDHDAVLQNMYAGPLTVTGHISLQEATYFAGDGETTRTLQPDTAYPLPDTGIICIDTGAGKGGCLTAMAVEAGRFVLLQ